MHASPCTLPGLCSWVTKCPQLPHACSELHAEACSCLASHLHLQPSQMIRLPGNRIPQPSQVYDTSAHQRIFTVQRPKSAAAMQHARPHLYWESDSLLYVGWASTVTVGTDTDPRDEFRAFGHR